MTMWVPLYEGGYKYFWYDPWFHGTIVCTRRGDPPAATHRGEFLGAGDIHPWWGVPCKCVLPQPDHSLCAFWPSEALFIV
jgi:hypothetical protein